MPKFLYFDEYYQMDAGKHVASARRIGLAILALAFTALYTVWLDAERNETLRLFNQFEQILAVRNLLAQQQPGDGIEVKLADLSHVDAQLFSVVWTFPTICQALEDIKSRGKLTPALCDSAETQKKYLLGMTQNDMQRKLHSARGFDLVGLRSEWGQDCPAIVFRGGEDEVFWIKGIGGTSEAHEVQGSLIYYVRLGNRCRLSRLEDDGAAFLLVDLRGVKRGWHFYAGEKLMEAIFGPQGYRLFKDSFLFNEDLRKKKGNDRTFDADRFFHDLPNPYRPRFARNVPSRFFVLPVTNIETRIIGESYVRTGVLRSASEMESALSSVYNVEKLTPTVAGVETNLRLWISISPVFFVILSFFFWYHVKRIAHSDSPSGEPWIFVDAVGYLEQTFAALWGILLVLTPVPIIYALLNRYEVALPRVPQILAWLGFNKDPIQVIMLRDAVLSLPAAIGTGVIAGAAFLIIYSLHLLVQKGSGGYSRFLMVVRLWFAQLTHLLTSIPTRVRRRIVSRLGSNTNRKSAKR